MPPRARPASAVLAVELFALALADGLVVAVGGPMTGLGWVRLREDLVLSNALLGLMLAVPGFLLARHRPGNAIGWLLLGGGVGYTTSAAGYVLLVLGTEPGTSGVGWRLLATATNLGWPWAVGLTILLTLLLFPDGRTAVRAGRALACRAGDGERAGLRALVGLSAGGLSLSAGVEGYPALTGAWLDGGWAWLTIPGLLLYLAGAATLVLRYRRGDETSRRQILWVLLAVIALVALQVVDAMLPGDGWLGILSLGLLPVGITVAILRAQLLDIRIVVSRSLLYLVLTGGVALAYTGLVGAAGWLSLGRTAVTPVLVVVLIAVAFHPLRVRLQRGLDRGFYGARRDPARALAAVGERLSEVAAPRGDGLTGVLEALCSVLRLPWAALVVDGVERAAYGERPAERYGVPLSSGGDVVGELVAGLRDQTTAAIAEIRRLVDDLGPPAALDALGLEGALREQAVILSRRADGEPLAVSLVVDGNLGGLPAAVEVAIYRIVTEALTNVVRHSTASAAAAAVSLTAAAGVVTVVVGDDGVNVASGWTPGVSLSSIRERTAELGGVCEIRHDRAGGRVSVTLPVSVSRPEPVDGLAEPVDGRSAGSRS